MLHFAALLFSICILGNKILFLLHCSLALVYLGKVTKYYSAPPVEALKFVLHKIKDTTSEDRT